MQEDPATLRTRRRALSARTLQLAVIAVAVAYAYLLIRTAWLCDDAYITFRTVENALAGRGLTYNTGERVQSYTHPAWMFLLCAARAVFSDMYEASLVLSMATSYGVLLALVWAHRRRPERFVLAGIVLCFSRAFVDFSTSGLENPLTHLLLLVFLARTRHEAVTARALAGQWLLIGLSALNRVDTVLLFVPWMAMATWDAWRQRGLRSLIPIVAGLSPFIAWELFSVAYYGFPWPNTAYAKLGTGIPRAVMIGQGLRYVANSALTDPLTVAAIASAIVLAPRLRDRMLRVTGTGALLYVTYVVWIGGDFMSGRLLTAPLLASVWILSHAVLSPERLAWLSAAAVGLGLIAQPPVFAVEPYASGAGLWENAQIANERSHYYAHTGLLMPRRNLTDFTLVKNGLAARQERQQVRLVHAAGLDGFYAGPEVHIVDFIALIDPLLARLPARPGPFRIGHVERELPPGYIETIATGQNQIQDKKLRRYYDVLSKIVHGPLFAADRLRSIVAMNTGQLDDLLPRAGAATADPR